MSRDLIEEATALVARHFAGEVTVARVPDTVGPVYEARGGGKVALGHTEAWALRGLIDMLRDSLRGRVAYPRSCACTCACGGTRR